MDFVFDSLEVKLWEAVIKNISGIEVNTPGDSLLYLALAFDSSFSKTSFSLFILDLTVSTFPLVFFFIMSAFYFIGSIGTLCLPSMYEIKLTKMLSFRNFRQADTIFRASLWFFLAENAFVDDGSPVLGSRNILLDLFILAEGRWNYRPLRRG